MSANNPSNSVPLLKTAPDGKNHWGQLYGSSQALAVAEYIATREALVVVVCPAMPDLLRFESELQFFSNDTDQIHSFIELETLPYDRISPHPDITSQRIRVLHDLAERQTGVLLITASALSQRVAPTGFLRQHALLLRTGDEIIFDDFLAHLVDAGYRHVSQVEEPGEFTRRGAIIDMFPMASAHPLRVEFLDNEIESIRLFDADTQLTLEKIDKIDMLPAHEFPLNEAGIRQFRRAFRDAFDTDTRNSPVYRAVSDGQAPAGIEYYLPLFFDSLSTVFDYLPQNSTFVLLDQFDNALDDFRESVEERYEQRRHDIERPVLPPDSLYLSPEQTRDSLNSFDQVRVGSFELDEQPGQDNYQAVHNFGTDSPGLFPLGKSNEKPADLLEQFLAQFDGRVLLTAESAGRRENLLEQLLACGIKPDSVESWPDFKNGKTKLALTTAPLDQGLQVSPPVSNIPVAVITEVQLGGGRVRNRERKRAARDSDAIIANLTDLNIGAPVVHIDHGVGRYQGLTILDVGGIETEFLTIAYAGDDKLYVPVSALHLISRYLGASEESAPLHKLGSDHWEKVKLKAAKKAHDVAAELLEIHARRAARKGFAYPADSDNYQQFSQSFAFEETPDQWNAIAAVVDDLRSSRPTDRVVCGDVGFGKTEVAMRAAFLAVDAGKQVAVLVPTTLLAQQHHQNFIDRFADWSVNIESMSRFKSAAEHKSILEKLASGGIDIVIGTHRLLQKDVQYKNLGLVVVDEEHRFGVRHKEHMKALRAEVDIVTLTATPIPRTLSMGLSGLRDLSIIATPPQHRHAIKTIVSEWSDNQIREACAREMSRGGQVYFLHNEVASIERMAHSLQEIMPQASIGVAHGQMRESELESVMYDFYHQRFNILLCTTIIESGIDVPSANTIIINRADKLGLAQLHQLRGRVGRSHHQAYAYLIAPPIKALSASAQKRLQAIESLEELGVGFTLATHDLEIRGAGELLGEGQSGQIQEIGFTLYTQLLERAVDALKSGKLPDYDQPLARATEIDLGVPALLPDAYVPDVHLRLILYKRIAHAKDDDTLRELKVELIDRFGIPPPQTDYLFESTRLRLRCNDMGIERLVLNARGGRLIFNENPAIDTEALIKLLQTEPEEFRFDGKSVLRISRDLEYHDERFEYIDALFNRLRKDSSPAVA